MITPKNKINKQMNKHMKTKDLKDKSESARASKLRSKLIHTKYSIVRTKPSKI